MVRVVLVAALLVLAGCQAPVTNSTESATASTTEPATAGSGNGTTITAGDVPDDPPSDRIGWEDGYWANETLAIDDSDGLSERELTAVVGRAMARIERIRGLEFESTVPVSVINRSTYRNRSNRTTSESLRRFDNAKFEALFLVGEGTDSVGEQEAAFEQSVLGYYSPDRDEIVIVSARSRPRLDGEGTLAHELVHALQDQHFETLTASARTRDAYQGRNGIVEGDAMVVQQRYTERCGDRWTCLDRSAGGGSGGGDVHLGLNFLQYFPYSDGPGFVTSRYERGGWDAVDAALADPPDGASEVTHPARYPGWEPADVALPDRSTDEWEQVRPPDRPNYAVVGPSAIAAALAHTVADDYEPDRVVGSQDIFNAQNGRLNRTDPYNYDLAGTRGWAGGRMHVYRYDEHPDGEQLGYVWRTKWVNDSRAATFERTWERLVGHWGGQSVGPDTWLIADESPFTDAIRIERSGATVTVTNGPTEADLEAIHDA